MKFKTKSGAEYTFKDGILTRHSTWVSIYTDHGPVKDVQWPAKTRYGIQLGCTAVFLVKSPEGEIFPLITTPVTEISLDEPVEPSIKYGEHKWGAFA